MASPTHNPSWVRVLLKRRWTVSLLRLALISAYLIGGLDKLLHFHAAVLEQAHFGLRPAWLWAALAIIIEIGGSLCVLFNRLTWLGAGALGVLTLVAMLVANDFWNLSGQAYFMALNSFFEHSGLIAGLAMATLLADDRPLASGNPLMRIPLTGA